MNTPILSICIATYNRGRFIGETLDSILPQLRPGIELVVVDGASPDNTPEVMAHYVLQYPEIRYYREMENSGIDRDYDKAVGYARGEYCWLMTDDDLLAPNAVSRALAKLNEGADLVVVNACVKSANLSRMLDESMFKFSSDRVFEGQDRAEFFQKAAQGLSFIGSAIVRREFWLSRNREQYYGTLFVHVGVIFQSPGVKRTIVIAEPLITIRFGNAMWTPRGFEIWMFKWPQLIWSFTDYSDELKMSVYSREPWRKVHLLALYRAIGGYGIAEYRNHISGRATGLLRLMAALIAFAPAALVNTLFSLHCMVANRQARVGMYSLLISRHATLITRVAARSLGVLE